jgi:hypothetical protein
VDRPAAFGDWLHKLLVVELAAALDRLTIRQVIAFIPVVILVAAYANRIPLPPELLLVGDLLAYIDIFSIVLLLSLFGRVMAMSIALRRAASQIRALLGRAFITLRRPDTRHRRTGAGQRKRARSRPQNEDDRTVPVFGLAWA